jgi:ABC-type lipoprotein release transport system permease subunit
VIENTFVGRAMKSVLYQVGAIDFASVGAVAMVLLVAAVLTCCVPARRVSRIDPTAALAANEFQFLNGCTGKGKERK